MDCGRSDDGDGPHHIDIYDLGANGLGTTYLNTINTPGLAAAVTINCGIACVGALLGLLLPTFAAIFIYRRLARKDWPDVDQKWNRYARYALVAFWFFVIPGISVPAGAMLGAGMALKRIVSQSEVIEKSGVIALRSFIASLLTHLEEDLDAESQVEEIQRYLDGEETIPVDSLVDISSQLSEGIVELAFRYSEEQIASESDSLTHKAAGKVLLWIVDWFDNTDEQEQWKLLSKIATAIQEHDQNTDADNQVTVDEIAATIAATTIKPKIQSWSTKLLILELAGEAVRL